jgi:hypothetical protein
MGDDELIETPWGKKRWGMLRRCMDVCTRLAMESSDYFDRETAATYIVDARECFEKGEQHG